MNIKCFCTAAISLNLIFGPALGADMTALVKDDSGKPIANAIIVAVPIDGPAKLPAKPAVEIMEQSNKEFVPTVLPILVGSKVSFPNRDSVRHHVYSFSPAKRFEFKLYAGTPTEPIVFDQPGVVMIGCNIHDWMIAHIYVSESPYFAKTDARGAASLSNLPPRAYMVRVWHPRSAVAEKETQKSADIKAGSPVDLQWALRLKPEVRVRRAPVPGGQSEY
jgi:plastocyanin